MVSAVCETPRAIEPPDWESPAGGDCVVPRASAGAYIYWGTANVHWLAQPCYVLDRNQTFCNEVEVVFACGCRATVPRGTLSRTRH